ncbi:hypothetical protein BDW02DRAFT_72614 [Decorospora gaudefroyi]|uniref:Uncharacterized protein n=1 Tax=Decorospora gaudefroyi TaxID=184978 RepID=A0A6A5K4P3_9PLEO|nr:hypothetical protein BDW02DRAFT_72614 [Decorospora gaudefroyi]
MASQKHHSAVFWSVFVFSFGFRHLVRFPFASVIIIARIWCGHDCAFSIAVSLLSYHKAWRGYLLSLSYYIVVIFLDLTHSQNQLPSTFSNMYEPYYGKFLSYFFLHHSLCAQQSRHLYPGTTASQHGMSTDRSQLAHIIQPFLQSPSYHPSLAHIPTERWTLQTQMQMLNTSQQSQVPFSRLEHFSRFMGWR